MAVVGEYLVKESSYGRLIHVGLLPADGLHVNRVGVIPKDHTFSRWRLITDLFRPPGWNINDGIDPGLCSLSHVKVDKVARIVVALGLGAMMMKDNIEAAYRLIPAYPDDRPLLAIH